MIELALYCTQCHRECRQLDDPDPDGQAERLSHCHSAITLDGDDKWIVMAIRRMWAADGAIESDGTVDVSGFDPDYPFGNASFEDENGIADLEILKCFKAERKYQDDDLHTIWVLIRG
jgi:hypothetical protein